MSTPSPHGEAAHRMRELCADNGLPEPDRVEYAPGDVWLFWDDTKVAVVIELDGEA